MNLLLFMLSAALYAFVAWRIQQKLLALNGPPLAPPAYCAPVAAAALFAAQIVLTAEILSPLQLLASRAAWLTVAVSFAAIVAMMGEPSAPAELPSLKCRGWAPRLVALAYLGLLLVALLLPANTWDSMTYHLSRIGYWLAQGHLGPFETNNLRQTEFPVNAELLMLWPVVFLRRDWLCPLVQFSAAIFSAAALYGIARELKQPPWLARLAALVALGFPQIALQATSTQNDLTCAFFILGAVLFLLRSAESGIGYAILFGVCAGLAFGTKPMALFFFPGFLILWLVRNRAMLSARFAAVLAAVAVVSIVVFSGSQMGRNWRACGFLLPAHDVARVQNPTVHTFAANAARTVVDLIDSNDLPYPVNRGVGVIKRAVATSVIKDFDALNPPAATFQGKRFEFRGNKLSEDFCWFGINGTLLFMLAVFGLLRPGRARLQWFAYASLPAGFFCACALLLRWQPWNSRFYCAAMLLMIPLGLRGVLLLRLRPAASRLAFKLIAALAVGGSVDVLVMNEMKPLMPRPGEKSVFSLTRGQQRCRHRPYNETIAQWLGDKPPLKVGFCADEDQWDYLAFGEDFRHHVIRFGDSVPWNSIFADKRCDVVFVQRSFVKIPSLPPGVTAVELNEEWTLVTPAAST